MIEELISFETAKLAKEKGFNEQCSAPTQSLLQKWLREVHNIHVNVSYGLTFTFKINGDLKGNDYVDYSNIEEYWSRTYEEALEKGLIEGLKLIE